MADRSSRCCHIRARMGVATSSSSGRGGCGTLRTQEEEEEEEEECGVRQGWVRS